MPSVFPFSAVQFRQGRGDVSPLIAPPYDVLDAAGKAALLAKDPRNVVAIDLPHTPAKELGPPSAYESAATTYQAWLKDGTLTRRSTPAMFAYRQTFTQPDGTRVQRCGMAATVEVVPFGPRAGGGILPHEETFSGPKEDRFALMKATKAQLSPIFGLFADDSGRATAIVRTIMASRGPDMTATSGEGVVHEVWTVADEPTIKAYQDALATEDIFIADGHHRYTTGLNYLKSLESAGPVPADHPARRSMMVLVGMSDPGLVIWPTHRVLGGMASYTFDKFLASAGSHLRVEPIAGDLRALGAALDRAGAMGEQRFALWDFQTCRGVLATPANADALASRFPEKPKSWRELTVAFCQYVIVEGVCQPALNGGQPVKWAFPHTIAEVEEIGKGAETGAGGGKGFLPQLAVIVRPTPLAAVRAVSKAGQLMPQKSTFFYPKLATGLWINPLA
ncbi:MAG: DUF1015 domain-containing protein [Phycisphaerae bacterium]|nr:DUF1015 domain-containing protein [Phycisphaerae bacterium]